MHSTDYICHNQMKQIAIIWMLESGSNHSVFNTALHGGQIESLWDCNYGRQGLMLSMEPSS